MTTDSTHSTPEQGIWQTLQSDVRRGDFWTTLSRELRGLREFFLDEDRKKRLAAMSTPGKAIWTAWWMLKGMILRLTPARRILLVVGVVFILAERSVAVDSSSSVTVHYGILGGLMLLFVLMLELKDKISGLHVGAAEPPAPSPKRSDLLSALANLGYSSAEADRAAAEVLRLQPDASLGDLLRDALRVISRR